jgi:hypothetical protein
MTTIEKPMHPAETVVGAASSINLNTIHTTVDTSSKELNTVINKILEKKVLEVPKRDRILDFLSAAGKIATICLAITPLPTYIGVWNK